MPMCHHYQQAETKLFNPQLQPLTQSRARAPSMPIGDVLAVIDEPARVSEGPVERGNSFMLSKDGEEKEARQAAATG